MQTTLIILKPDCVQRGLMGEVIGRFERKGLRIVAARFMQVPDDLARTHYGEHEGKPFFESLLEFITATPVLVMAVRGRKAVEICRTLIGPTDGSQAPPGTIRGDYGMNNSTNLVHGSDSPESAEREMNLWFDPAELIDWRRDHQPWIDP